MGSHGGWPGLLPTRTRGSGVTSGVGSAPAAGVVGAPFPLTWCVLTAQPKETLEVECCAGGAGTAPAPVLLKHASGCVHALHD